MERTNLESLVEEEDEEPWENSEDGTTEGEFGDGGIKQREPNQFDSLCDGLHNSLAVLHASLQELLELKDELLKHHLPPSVLNKISLTSSKTYRSVSDLHAPANELIRLVKLYSTPWEEKSTALKKLHEDYEGKKTQLNIAIKRLQLIDAHSRQIAKERRIMNWEKVFSKLTMARGHGRRWKFLIEGFKANAKLGTDHLQMYLDSLDKDSSDEEDEEEEEAVDTQMQQVSSVGGTSEHKESEDEEDEDDDDDSEDESEAKTLKDEELTSEVGTVGDGDEDGRATYIRPPMRDKEVWTHQPEYDRTFHVRVHQPEGLDCQQVLCALQLGNQRFKTGLLDEVQEEPKEEKLDSPASSEASQHSSSNGTKSTQRPGRGLIGTRGGRPGAARSSSSSTAKEVAKQKKLKFEEVVFTIPDDVPSGVTKQRLHGQPAPEQMPETLNIAVHFGAKEEIYAMANVDIEDLEHLELPTVYFPPPRGDLANTAEAEQHANDTEADYKAEAEQDANDTEADYKAEAEMALSDAEILPFPLYSVEGGSTPCGTIPVTCYWGKRERPRKYNRSTENQTVQELVFDMTGIDLKVKSKEDLFPDTRDEALSAFSFTPEPKEEEELVPKSQYDRLIRDHHDELDMLQQEYEQRLQDLADSLQEMQQAQLHASQLMAMQMQERPVSVRNKAIGSHSPLPPSRTPTPQNRLTPSVMIDGATLPPPPGYEAPSYDENNRSKKAFKTGKSLPNWGENLPKNFLERLKLFEEQSRHNREMLSQQIQQQTAKATERKLADQYKITGKPDEELYDPLQDVSLPAVFMPNKSANIHIFNPRANNYFHPTGAGGARLTQPPSMLQLPPIPKSKLSVVNLFDLSQNFHRGGPEWLMQRFIQQQEGGATKEEVSSTPPTTGQRSQQTLDSDNGMASQERTPDYDSPQDLMKMYSHVPSPPQPVME